MTNKLTSLTGFGEGDPKPERKKSINDRIELNRAASGGGAEGRVPHKYGHFGKTTPKNEGERRFMSMMKKQKGPTFENQSAKSKALKKKTSSADGIDKERKRQGYKPLDAKTRRIHEGMDKFLP